MRQPQQGLSMIGRVLHAVRPEAVDVVSHSHSEVSQLLRSGLTGTSSCHTTNPAKPW